MIFFFSGTGNSAWAARKLAGALGDEAADIGSFIRDEKNWEGEAETAVFVTPTYAWRIPKLVEAWIGRSSFGRPKAWFVMTCGDDIGSAGEYNRKLAESRGMAYMGSAKLVMPENYTAMFETPDQERAKAIIREAEPKLEALAERIGRKEAFPEAKLSPADRIKSRWVNPAFYRLFVKDKAFAVSDACISCGKCVLGCPVKNIRLEDGRPVWEGRCTHCMACINACPMEAIEYGRKSRKRCHYTCPF